MDKIITLASSLSDSDLDRLEATIGTEKSS